MNETNEFGGLTKREKLKDVQLKTFQDMVNTLREHGLCNVERPTGFGKTALFTLLMRQLPGKEFLYVYDTNTTLDKMLGYGLTNATYVSYSLLSRKERFKENKELLTSSKYDFIIFDESHLIGGENIRELYEECKPIILSQGHKIIGGTATPIRSDLVDTTEQFFDGNTVFDYELRDAFEDGLMEEPLYTVLWDKVDKLKNVKVSNYTLGKLKQLEHAYATRIGVSEIYRRKVLEVYGEIPSYMQFICFYPTIKSIKDKEQELIDDFAKAFPERNIRVLKITSDNEHKEGYEDLVSKKFPNTVDIIMCVDMLNQGYHSEDITGIVMNRTTFSNIIYTQQVGRCLNVMSDKKTIVFDNVANFSVDPLVAMGSLKDLEEAEVKNTGSRVRKYERFKFKVSAEDLEISEWYNRLNLIRNVTEEDIAKARRARTKYGAPLDFLEKRLNIPRWLLEQELTKPGEI